MANVWDRIKNVFDGHTERELEEYRRKTVSFAISISPSDQPRMGSGRVAAHQGEQRQRHQAIAPIGPSVIRETPAQTTERIEKYLSADAPTKRRIDQGMEM